LNRLSPWIPESVIKALGSIIYLSYLLDRLKLIRGYRWVCPPILKERWATHTDLGGKNALIVSMGYILAISHTIRFFWIYIKNDCFVFLNCSSLSILIAIACRKGPFPTRCRSSLAIGSRPGENLRALSMSYGP
jgi:hypothetical protein